MAKAPNFAVPRESGRFRWWRSLKALCTAGKFDPNVRLSYPFHDRTVRKSAFRGRSVSSSLLLHCSAIFLLVYLHQAYPDNASNFEEVSPTEEVIYYPLPEQRLPKVLPHIVPLGPGGSLMRGVITDRPSAPGNTAGQDVLTIISKPAHPDNNHQTIIQPSTPPDLRITNDIKLPNVILGKSIAAPKAPLQFNANDAKPASANKQATADQAPAPAPANPQAPAVAFLTPSTFKPVMPVGASKGTGERRGSNGSEGVEAPDVSAATTSTAFVAPANHFTPTMPVGASQGTAQRRSSSSGTGPVEAPNVNAAATPTPFVTTSNSFAPHMPVGASQGTAQPRSRTGGNSTGNVEAPDVSAEATSTGFATASNNFTPHMPVGASQGTAQPRSRTGGNGAGNVEAPNVNAETTSTGFITASNNFTPAMPVGASRGAAQPRSRTGGSGTGNVEAPNVNAEATSGDSLKLAVLSADPGAPTSVIKLPPGNRMGEFAVSEGAGAGSPGGSAGGVVSGGSGAGKIDKGGNGSTGIGPETHGGGGATLSEAPVAIHGTRASDVASGMLGVALARGIVYPVPMAFNLRKNSIIVSAGPIGGGALDAYGALQCGKVYSIFLPMPGKNWTMQYCPQNAPAGKTAADPPTVAHFGEGIVPPQANTKFDFRRLPVSQDKVRKMIILKGILRSDGIVDQLEVYQGVLPEMDDDARLAFSQWKFQPALREGKPISVQILVGIPAQLPSAQPAR
ncbi:MAG: energy transducer TonB [Candidatus Acidiferrales bacterium]